MERSRSSDLGGKILVVLCPLPSHHTHDYNSLLPLPIIWIAFCNYKSLSQILSHLTAMKILLRSLRLVEVKWLAQDHVTRDVTWLALEPGFPVTFPYSVPSSVQIWCQSWEAIPVLEL